MCFKIHYDSMQGALYLNIYIRLNIFSNSQKEQFNSIIFKKDS